MGVQTNVEKFEVLIVDPDEERRRSVCTILEASEKFFVSVAEIPYLLAGAEAPEAVLVGLGEIGDLEAVELCREIKGLPEPPATVLYGSWAGTSSTTSEGRGFLFTVSLADGYLPGSLVRKKLLATLWRILPA